MFTFLRPTNAFKSALVLGLLVSAQVWACPVTQVELDAEVNFISNLAIEKETLNPTSADGLAVVRERVARLGKLSAGTPSPLSIYVESELQKQVQTRAAPDCQANRQVRVREIIGRVLMGADVTVAPVVVAGPVTGPVTVGAPTTGGYFPQQLPAQGPAVANGKYNGSYAPNGANNGYNNGYGSKGDKGGYSTPSKTPAYVPNGAPVNGYNSPSKGVVPNGQNGGYIPNGQNGGYAPNGFNPSKGGIVPNGQNNGYKGPAFPEAGNKGKPNVMTYGDYNKQAPNGAPVGTNGQFNGQNKGYFGNDGKVQPGMPSKGK